MLPRCVAICLCLLLTPPALASASEGAAPHADGGEAAAGELFPRSSEELEPRPPQFAVGRMMLELLGGAAGGIAGVYASYLFVVSLTRDQPGLVSHPQRVIDVAGLASLGVGSSLGVYGVGTLAGAHSSYWKTLLGSTLGTLLGVLSILTFGENEGTAVLTLAGAAVGGMLAFEMSPSDGGPTAESLPQARNNSRTKQVRLVFAASPRGHCFGGLAGSF